MTRLWPWMLGVWLLTSGHALAQVTVSMRASATDVRADDTFQLQISIESESLQNPDVVLPPMDDFVVVQRQVSRPMSFSFSFGGRQQAVKSTTNYLFVLQPTREGRFVLPAAEARVGNQRFRSQPLTINVRNGTAPPAAQNAPDPNDATSDPNTSAPPASGPIADAADIDEVAFIRAVADKSEAFVGEQVTVTFYLYLRGNVQAQPTVDTQPTTDGFWTYDLLAPNAQVSAHRQVVKGLTYTALTLRRLAAFPLRDGELTIGPMAITIDQSSVFDLFAGRAPAVLKRNGLPLVIKVKPLPPQGKPNADVAIGTFTVQAKLDRNQAATGDAVTLSATVQGAGNIRAVNLATPVVDGLRVLEPQVRDVVEAPGDRAGGMRTYEWLVVPERPGSYAIEPLTLHVFDPATAKYGVVTSDPLTLIAAGAAKPTLAPQATDSETPDAQAEQEVEPSVQELAPVRTSSQLTRRATPLMHTLGFRSALAAMPLLWLLLTIGGAVSTRIKAKQSAPNADRSLRDARKRLDSAASLQDAAAFYAAVAQAIGEALQARLAEPIGGYTRTALATMLVSRGMDDVTSQRVIALMSRCELGRFSSMASSRSEMDETLAEAKQCFERIARFAPTETATNTRGLA